MVEKKIYPTVEESVYRLNGTFMAEGDAGKALNEIGVQLKAANDNLAKLNETLTKCNWNFGNATRHLEAMITTLAKR